MANPHFAMRNRPSLQFELKLLTKFLLRIQPDCQTSAHCTRDREKANTMPASKAVRPQPKPPWTKIQPVTGRLDYNQKLGNLKELLQKGGYRDFSRKILPLPRLAAYPTLTK